MSQVSTPKTQQNDKGKAVEGSKDFVIVKLKIQIHVRSEQV